MLKTVFRKIWLYGLLFTLLIPGSVTAAAAEAMQTEAAPAETEQKDAEPYDGRLSRVTDAGYTIEIRDEEGLLTKEEAEALLDEMEDIGTYTNAVFGSYSGKQTTEVWTNANYYRHGFFSPGGVAFVINMELRKLNVRYAGNTGRILGYSTATAVEDNVYQYASKGDYYTCASKVFSQVAGLYRGQRVAQPMKAVISLLLGLCIGMMILFLYVRGTRTQQRIAGTMLAGSIGAAALATAVQTTVNERKRIRSESSSGGFSGGGGSFGGGGSGGGTSGGAGHSF